MNQHRRRSFILSAVAITTSALSLASPAAVAERKAAGGVASVDGARIVAADREPQNWLAHGRTYDEQRYSPLAKINDANVGELGLAWSYATGTTARPAGEPDRRGRHDVHDGHLERGVGARCEDGPRAVEVRPGSAA